MKALQSLTNSEFSFLHAKMIYSRIKKTSKFQKKINYILLYLVRSIITQKNQNFNGHHIINEFVSVHSESK